MMKNIRLNPSMSYLVKADEYAVFYDFNYYFFRGQAAILFKELLDLLDVGGSAATFGRPDFIEYLINKKIVEVRDD